MILLFVLPSYSAAAAARRHHHIYRAFHSVEPRRGAVFYFRNHTVLFGAVFIVLRIVPCGAVRFSLCLNGAVRCGAVRIIFSRIIRCGTVRLSVEQLFPTVRLSVHRS